jgi:hypothetical protein
MLIEVRVDEAITGIRACIHSAHRPDRTSAAEGGDVKWAGIGVGVHKDLARYPVVRHRQPGREGSWQKTACQKASRFNWPMNKDHDAHDAIH